MRARAFSRCLHRTRAPPIAVYKTYGVGCPVKKKATGLTIITEIAPKDVYRLRSTTAHQNAKSANPTTGASAIVVPAPVATALPPLKPRKTGQQCPTTAANATAATTHSFSVRKRARKTGANPFSMSPAIVITAGHVPTVRRTLAIPMFPLPARRTSTPQARPTRKPVGTEPST